MALEGVGVRSGAQIYRVLSQSERMFAVWQIEGISALELDIQELTRHVRGARTHLRSENG